MQNGRPPDAEEGSPHGSHLWHFVTGKCTIDASLLREHTEDVYETILHRN